MIRKTVTAGLAALTLVAALGASVNSAQAGWRGAAVTAGILGLALGAAAAASARPAYPEPVYDYGYGCGYVYEPVYDVYGEQVGWRRVLTC
ncbi:hypothetical protein [Methylobacterium organophilum]|uniref:Transmembrane protein n=1 Tax=Methylobacterium organophilum TaxID=410 RepID=A0ABQ4T1L0_METOR|nr:hypothetical protein [Methylobacterium organophilum]GJE25527.1 hypothetical protein LKMONMHP_0365 [Methylobacterium organophilum]